MPSTADTIALDGASVRTIDADGHLHVSESPISKAMVCGYYGREIPRHAELGLEPDRMYQLLRDPKELEKSAPTFHGKPLLSTHKPQTAEDHDHELTVGSVSNPRWSDPYLMAALDVWEADAIRAIQSGDQSELSAGYYYDPDMTPGTFDGAPYDGVMRNLRANHVALVSKGRAGSDVCVGDAAPSLPSQQEPQMPAPKLNTAGAALAAVLARKFARKVKLAMDRAPDAVKPALKDATLLAWRDTGKKVRASLKSGIAQDADIANVVTMLDQLDDITDEMDDVAQAMPAKDDDMTDMNMDGDAEMMAKLKTLFPDMNEESLRKMCAAAKPVAMDEPPGATPKPGDTPKPSLPPEKPVTKAAMDAAIAKVRADTRAETEAAVMARLNARGEAAAAVRPLVGDVNLAAMDSAEAVYRYALAAKGVKLDGIPDAGLAAVFGAIAKAETAPRGPIRPAMDAAAAKALETRFPNINRLRA